MTSDEITKEFEAWCGDAYEHGGWSLQAYLAAAEPREKRIAELEATLTAINAIRNSIIGAQTMNWSEHIYPLVAALDRAGVEGLPYPDARKNVGTLLERIAELEASDAYTTEQWLRDNASNYAANSLLRERIAELEQERDRAVEVADSATKGVYSKYMLEAADAIGRDLSQGLEINGLKARLARVTEAFERLWTEYQKDPQRKRNGPEAAAIEDIRAVIAEEQEQKPCPPSQS
jgi:hypothetical protein